ncbi:hypothetical protein KEM48_012297 [Puccinia striiformis f. sp. tritici PST-130]|nr:hypothetical protein KEM48_012297 [Puccinia striiformis f. sp. tritici PST-130]
MLFLRVLLNFLVAGKSHFSGSERVAIASVVPAEKSGVSAPKSTGKRDVDEDGSGSVLFEYSSSVSVSIESKFGLIVDSCNSGKYQVVESALEEILHKFSDLNSNAQRYSPLNSKKCSTSPRVHQSLVEISINPFGH